MPSHPVFTITPSGSPCPDEERIAALADPGFGRVFTDHMVTIEWSRDAGWHDPQVRAREPFPIDPASSILHFGQEIFEGLKAYQRDDGAVTLFRLDENARRFNASARRLAMPELPEDLFRQSIEHLISMDRRWMPEGEGTLYIRPFMFANDVCLVVQPARHYVFCVIAWPAGPYFKGGAKPLSLWVSEHYSRAAPGGTGAAKCGGNYAGSFIAQAQAIEQGCDQVVFLDAAEHRWVEELGGMNIFFVMDDVLIRTPSLGTILAGVTRSAVIDLARSQGHRVVEEPYAFDQWIADAASGRLREVFVCGTAVTVLGVGTVRFDGGEFSIGDGRTGPTTERLRSQLVDIQRGRTFDPFGWCATVLPGA